MKKYPIKVHNFPAVQKFILKMMATIVRRKLKTEATKIELKTGDFLSRIEHKYDIDGE